MEHKPPNNPVHRPRGKRLPAHVQNVIKKWAIDDPELTPAQMRRSLERAAERPEKTDVRPQDVPTARAIQRIVRKYRPAEEGGSWTLAGANDEDAARMLPLLAALMERTEGRLATRLGRGAAKLMIRVRTVAPDLAPGYVLDVATAYMLREIDDEKTDDLDTLLAFAPWRSRELEGRFWRFVRHYRPEWVRWTKTRSGGFWEGVVDGTMIAARFVGGRDLLGERLPTIGWPDVRVILTQQIWDRLLGDDAQGIAVGADWRQGEDNDTQK